MRRLLPFLLALGWCGCSSDVSREDASAPMDAGLDVPESTIVDSALNDSALDDSALADSSVEDSAVENIDARPATGCDSLGGPLERAGEQGRFGTRFVSSTPAIDVKGRYDWVIEVMDSGRALVTGAEVEVVPFMPAHGHGTSPVTVISSAESAQHQLNEINLFMAGLWEVRITIRKDGMDDRVVWRPCVREPDGGSRH